MKPLGLIVAGGKSERFGSPKILHEIDGIPQWERLANAMFAFCDKIILNIPTNLRSKFPEKAPFEFLLEDTQNGPLEGLCKAFETYPNRDWLVVGSDHFWVESETFQVLDRPHSTFFTDDIGEIVPWLGKIAAADLERILEFRKQGEKSFFRILNQLPIQKMIPAKTEWAMDGDFSEKIQLLHPTESGVMIDFFTYELFKSFIERTMKKAGSLPFFELQRIAEHELAGRIKGSIPWVLISVKLDLEARGILVRIPNSQPEQYTLG